MYVVRSICAKEQTAITWWQGSRTGSSSSMPFYPPPMPSQSPQIPQNVQSHQDEDDDDDDEP